MYEIILLTFSHHVEKLLQGPYKVPIRPQGPKAPKVPKAPRPQGNEGKIPADL